MPESTGLRGARLLAEKRGASIAAVKDGRPPEIGSLRQARIDALEEAAKVVENAYPFEGYEALRQAAAAIRKLKETGREG